MRIDKFTKIVNLTDSLFICNIKSGAVDAVDKFIVDEIEKLSILKSFTPLESNLKESIIEEMINRGYITYYSEKEETDERKWMLEKHKEKLKKEEKTVSLILDNVVGSCWCYKTDSFENLTVGRLEFVELLKNIKNRKLASKIDLWLLIKNRIKDWAWIVGETSKNDLMINSLYTLIYDNIELKEISDWIRGTPTAPNVVQIKCENKNGTYLTFSKEDSKTIHVTNNIFFMSKHPFFCPLIYKTFFMDNNRNISYCVKKLLNEKEIKQNSITPLKNTPEIRSANGLFSTNCEQSDKCIFSIYCSRMCPYLVSIYNNMTLEDCNLIPIFNSLLETKIKSMV